MKHKTNTQEAITQDMDVAIDSSTVGRDLKNAILVVSVLANLFVLVAWVTLQVTTQFNAQVSSLLFK